MATGLLELPTDRSPLSLFVQDVPAPAAFGASGCQRFEFSSRGDRVPGRLLLPPRGARPHPMVLLEHGAGGAKDAPYLDVAARWVEAGVAVATIDLPLHGERRSPKLSESLLSTIRAGVAHPESRPLDPASEGLWIGFARQSLCDLSRCVDVMTQLEDVDAERIVYASFSLGSLVGALFCALDQRPRAAALALGGAGFGPQAVDPGRYIGKLTPRPVLMINAERDRVISRSAAEALFAAAGEPKVQHWYDAAHESLPGAAMKTMWAFIQEQLEHR